jgi:hypothetical protein
MLQSENSLIDRLQESMMSIMIHENTDERAKKLAKAGLIDRSDYSKFNKLMSDMKQDTPLTPMQKMMILQMFDKLLELVMSDRGIYQKILKKVKEDNNIREKRERETFESLHTIVEKNNKKYYVNDNDQLELYTQSSIKEFINKNKQYKHL